MFQIINRKAKYDYSFIERYNAGICLVGSEVKAIKDSKVSMVDSYCLFLSGEIYIRGLNITIGPGSFQHDPNRDKKLLLKKKELRNIKDSLQKGITIIPVRIFTSERGKLKIEIALATGKKSYDKRNSIMERDVNRRLRDESYFE